MARTLEQMDHVFRDNSNERERGLRQAIERELRNEPLEFESESHRQGADSCVQTLAMRWEKNTVATESVLILAATCERNKCELAEKDVHHQHI